MLRHHTGSGRRRVIPLDWSEHHRQVVEGTMASATVELRNPTAAATSQEWDDETEQWVTVPAGAYWSGGARIQMLNQQAQPVVVASDPETVADYLVVVPATVAGVKAGHRAKVASCDDPDLVGKTLRVQTVAYGSHRFERDLFCELTD